MPTQESIPQGGKHSIATPMIGKWGKGTETITVLEQVGMIFTPTGEAIEALGPIYLASCQGRRVHVTREWLETNLYVPVMIDGGDQK